MSDDCLPDCMMPDGGQCCAGYTKQRHRIEALEAECERLRLYVPQIAVYIEGLFNDVRIKADRIEALEAALRFYAEPKNYSDDYWKGMWKTARAALAPEQDK